jgi:hypothetical protein
VLIIDIIVKVVLNCYIRFSKAITSLYNLYIECFCPPSKDIGKHSMELFFLDIYLLTDTKEDLNLIIKQIVRIACVFIAIVLELRELRNCVSVQLIIAGLAWR